MERINEILKHDLFIECCNRIENCEKNRIFCHHDMTHFLDVCRLALICSMQDGLEISKELIYAAGLLHDIGRFRQYEEQIPHEEASAVLAPTILRDCGFEENETDVIVHAIRSHRDVQVAEEKSLAGVIYRGDKLSRSCFACKVEAQCNWKKEKKNLNLVL